MAASYEEKRFFVQCLVMTPHVGTFRPGFLPDSVFVGLPSQISVVAPYFDLRMGCSANEVVLYSNLLGSAPRHHLGTAGSQGRAVEG